MKTIVIIIFFSLGIIAFILLRLLSKKDERNLAKVNRLEMSSISEVVQAVNLVDPTTKSRARKATALLIAGLAFCISAMLLIIN
jgi:hypothetical protein